MSNTDKNLSRSTVLANQENILWYQALVSDVEFLELPQQIPLKTGSSLTDGRATAETTFKQVTHLLSDLEYANVIDLANSTDTSPECIFVALWQILINRYCRTDDLALAIETTLLNPENLNNSGITVLRQTVSNKFAFEKWIRETADHLHTLRTNGAATLDVIENYFEEKQMATSNSNYSILLQHASLPAESANKHNLSFSLDLSTSKYIKISVNYHSSLFNVSDIERMLEHFKTLLKNGSLNPSLPVNKLHILANDEHQLVTETFNSNRQDYCADCGFTDLFEKQVRITPDRIAVSTADCKLTYQELFDQVDRMSTWLTKYALKPDDLVAICLPRKTELLVTQIAVQRTGAAYLPIDPDYPEDRIKYILDDASAQLFITTSSFDHRENFSGSVLLELDKVWSDIQDTTPLNIKHQATADNLAYVIYTSGSTGKPKGVQITRRNLVNQLIAVQHVPPFSAEDVVIALTTVAFDVSIVELFLPLTVGARVHIAPREIAKDGHLLRKEIESEGVTRLDATPSLWRLLLEAGWAGNKNLTGIVGGEALPLDLANTLIPKLKSFWNMYGPTETTVSCTAAQIENANLPITIGRPLANYRIYVLNEDNCPCPVNVTGEICVAGDSTARGYLNRPDLNQVVFSEDPFVKDAGQMYRTGDLGRWLQDGTVECLGRIDSQVKLRGYRIELGEIESLISDRTDISHSVVILGSNQGNDYLAAYVVPNDFNQCSLELETSIRTSLKGSLPPYMIPSTITFLEGLPVTPNGKVDIKALSELEAKPDDRKIENPLITDTEKHIAALWTELLGNIDIGRDDNFFTLGGHSLLAMRFVTRANTHYESKLTARTIVTSSIAQIAEILSPNAPESEYSVTKEADEPSSLLPAFISSNKHKLFTGLHKAGTSEKKPGKQPVLICQPIGHEYQRSQRATRLLATELAKTGRDVLRFDYAGTGDSMGNLEDVSVNIWQQNIIDASEFLMEHAKSDSFAGIGMRLGGLLLLSSKPDKLEELVLWDSLSSGDQWISSLDAMTRLAMNNLDRFRLSQTDKLDHEYFGYLFNKETVDSVKGLQQDDFHQSIPASVLFLNSDTTNYNPIGNQEHQPVIVNENQLWEDYSIADDMVITPLSTNKIVKWFG